jgi:hypothetical protein
MFAGIAPAYIEVLLEAAFPAYPAFLRTSAVALNLVLGGFLLPLLALPFITGYAVLVHRLLDVRLVVRYGVRYLLAKWTLVVLTLTPFGLLISHVTRIGTKVLPMSSRIARECSSWGWLLLAGFCSRVRTF